MIYWDLEITSEKSNTIRFNTNSFVTSLVKKEQVLEDDSFLTTTSVSQVLIHLMCTLLIWYTTNQNVVC